MASDNIRPAILGPFDLLDGGFTPQRAPAARISEGFVVVMPRTTAQRGVIPFAGRGIDQRAMPLLLQIGTRRVEIQMNGSDGMPSKDNASKDLDRATTS